MKTTREILYLMYDALRMISNAEVYKLEIGLFCFKQSYDYCEYDDTVKIAKDVIHTIYADMKQSPFKATESQRILFYRMFNIIKSIANAKTFSVSCFLDYYSNLVEPKDSQKLAKSFLKTLGDKNVTF